MISTMTKKTGATQGKKGPKKSTTRSSNTRLISEVMAMAGSIGGKARAAKMTAAERKASALKASRAAAEARTKKANRGK
jgi:hypothetical protein